MVAVDLEHKKGEKMMTNKEKVAFAHGVEEGFVRAAELSGDPDVVLRQFRPVSPEFKTNVTRRVSTNNRKWTRRAK